MTPLGSFGLRPMLPADIPEIAAIFRAAIIELTEDDYTAAQQDAWAAAADDEEGFAARLSRQTTLVATFGDELAGFASLKSPDVVDMLYVHPAVAGQGAATKLYQALEKLARSRGAAVLAVEASDTARAFFEKHGFVAQHRNTVVVGDEWLGNTSMTKKLDTQATSPAPQTAPGQAYRRDRN